MSLFVLLLQIHRVRGKGQFDLSNTKILCKIYRTPNSAKVSVCQVGLFSHSLISFNSSKRSGLGGGCLIYRSSGPKWGKCCGWLGMPPCQNCRQWQITSSSQVKLRAFTRIEKRWGQLKKCVVFTQESGRCHLSGHEVLERSQVRGIKKCSKSDKNGKAAWVKTTRTTWELIIPSQ